MQYRSLCLGVRLSVWKYSAADHASREAHPGALLTNNWVSRLSVGVSTPDATRRCATLLGSHTQKVAKSETGEQADREAGALLTDVLTHVGLGIPMLRAPLRVRTPPTMWLGWLRLHIFLGYCCRSPAVTPC
jgi:hypothetical protein